MGKVHIAQRSYVCAICPKPILPGMLFLYICKEHRDKHGNRAVEISKAHTHCAMMEKSK